jgi:hypothetical protein
MEAANPTKSCPIDVKYFEGYTKKFIFQPPISFVTLRELLLKVERINQTQNVEFSWKSSDKEYLIEDGISLFSLNFRPIASSFFLLE